jgi:multiple sugar transport system substrate-binding protein
MKKLLCIITVCALIITMNGCGKKSPGNDAPVLSDEPLSGEITVSCYDTLTHKDFLEATARSFMDANPGTTVNIQTESAMPEIKRGGSGGQSMAMIQQEDDAQGKSDYIKKISAELMSGRGADILAMDILPWTKYAEMEQLEDLNAYFEQDRAFSKSDFRANILEALSYNGGQYIVPLDYNFGYLSYDSTFFNESEQQALDSMNGASFEQLIEFAGPAMERDMATNGSDASKLFSYRSDRFLNELLMENYSSFVDVINRKANFNDGKFAALLNKVKDYGEKGWLTPGGGVNTDSVFSGARNDASYFFKTSMQYSRMLAAIERPGMRVRIATDGSMGNSDNDKVLGLNVNSAGQSRFTYSQAYGINSNSQNKNLAWAFLRYMLSEEIQSGSQLSMGGLPVNNIARAKRQEQAASGELFARGGPGGQKIGGGPGPGGGPGEPGANGPGGAGEPGQNGPGGPGEPGQAGSGGQDQGESGAPVQVRPGAEGQDNPEGQQPMIRQQGNPEGQEPMIRQQGDEGSSPEGQEPMVRQQGDSQGIPQRDLPELSAEDLQRVAEYMTWMESCSDKLNYCPVEDDTIRAAIQEEVKNFFNGIKTAEEAADALQSKVDLYLNE